MSSINNFWKSEFETDYCAREKCCGCSACENICPKQAISMRYDREGFLYPVVDSNKCISCGKCVKVCPMANPPEQAAYIHTYAGYSKEPDIIEKCASGGICTAVSRYVIACGGVVFGVRYQNDYIKAEYSKALTLEDLDAFMTSKYVQSTKNQIFAEVKSDLNSNRLVAFIGCPCDISALYLFLGKEYDNLLTVELVCMGVTNYKVAEAYIAPRVKKWGSLTKLNSKGKKYGWFVPCLEEVYESGKHLSNGFFGTYYGYGFTKFQRPSCSQCPYRGEIGRGDIRTGDFWGIKRTDEFWNPMGVSCIFARTEKGNKVLNELKERNFSLFEVSYEKASVNNNMHKSKNYTEEQQAVRKRFANIFLSKGLISACRETATLEFWIKHFVPTCFANTLKHIRHAITDIKT